MTEHVTPAEAADLLGCSLGTLKILLHNDVLESFGAGELLSKEDVLAYAMSARLDAAEMYGAVGFTACGHGKVHARGHKSHRRCCECCLPPAEELAHPRRMFL